ncbi:MAG: MFS transporter [Actinobacteria bacterium]|nr:MFS transporter [Actinomycetota bacterium]
MAEKTERQPFPRGFWVIWTTVAVDLIGFGIVLPILPQYAERFGAGAAVIGVLSASFSLAQLVFAPVWGKLSDRIGRKPIIIISLFGTAIGSLVTGFAGALWVLFLGRIIDGISGASVSVAQAAVADISPARQRARYMGLIGAAFGVGFVAGPAIGALAALGGPKVPFFVAAAIAAVNALIALKRLPETARGVKGHPLARADEVALREAEFVAANADAENIAAEPALDGPGIVEPSHGALHHENADHTSPDRRAEIIRLIVVAFVGVVAFSGFEATFSLLANNRYGLGLSATAAVFAGIGVVLVGVQGGLVGPITHRLGEGGTLRFGLIANCFGLLVLAFDLGWAGLVVALLLLTVGQGLLTPTLSSAVAGRAGLDTGVWLGWQQSAGGAARVIGPLAAGALFQWVGMGWPYAVGAGLAAFALTLLPKRSEAASRVTAG